MVLYGVASVSPESPRSDESPKGVSEGVASGQHLGFIPGKVWSGRFLCDCVSWRQQYNSELVYRTKASSVLR